MRECDLKRYEDIDSMIKLLILQSPNLFSLSSHNTYLAKKTATSSLSHQLVTNKSHTHRDDCGRAISLHNVRSIRLSRSIAVAVVENSIICLVNPLPENGIESLDITSTPSTQFAKKLWM